MSRQKFTIRILKDNLTKTFPDIEFTYGPPIRRHQHGHRIAWTGGPSEKQVRQLSGAPAFRYRGATGYYFERENTPEEWEAQQRQWDIEDAAHAAAKPARRAAAKAAGIEKRKATAATKRTIQTRLSEAFPGVTFTLTTSKYGSIIIYWVDGPSIEDVTALLKTVSSHHCHRTQSPAFLIAETTRLDAEKRTRRTARRLAQSKLRAIRVARGIERQSRLEFEKTRQLWLPFMFSSDFTQQIA